MSFLIIYVDNSDYPPARSINWTQPQYGSAPSNTEGQKYRSKDDNGAKWLLRQEIFSSLTNYIFCGRQRIDITRAVNWLLCLNGGKINNFYFYLSCQVFLSFRSRNAWEKNVRKRTRFQFLSIVKRFEKRPCCKVSPQWGIHKDCRQGAFPSPHIILYP